jgi:hypothetical protein
MNRFPSSRCASAIQIVRPWESPAKCGSGTPKHPFGLVQ